MKRRSIARIIAMVLVGYGFAFLIKNSDADDLAHYRATSGDKLVAELTKKSDKGFDEDFFEGLLVVAVVTGLVEGIGVLVALAIDRVSPPIVVLDHAEDTEVAAGPRFH